MNEDNEIFKQFVFQLVRYIFIALGSWLVRKGIIDQSLAESLSGTDVVWSVAGLTLIAIPVVWGYCKSRFNVKFARAAHEADNNTPLSVIKNEVLNSESRVSSI